MHIFFKWLLKYSSDRNSVYLRGELSEELALVPELDSLSNSCCKMSAHSLLVIPFIGLCDFSGLVSWLSILFPTDKTWKENIKKLPILKFYLSTHNFRNDKLKPFIC